VATGEPAPLLILHHSAHESNELVAKSIHERLPFRKQLITAKFFYTFESDPKTSLCPAKSSKT